MNIKTKEAGDRIDFKCTRCKILTTHTIVVIVAGKVARVKCNACGGEHNYHPPKEEKAPVIRRSTVGTVRKVALSSSKKDPAVNYQEQWHTALARLEGTTAESYEMEGKYRKDMLIAHPIFGLGAVTSLSFGKMEVLFKDGPKWLGCR